MGVKTDMILATELYPTVKSVLKDNKAVAKFEQIIGSFIDKNSEKFSAAGPTTNIMFTENEKAKVYDLVGIAPNDVKLLNKKSSAVKAAGTVMNDPFRSLMGMIVRYFSLTKDEKRVKIASVYLGCSLYPSLFYKYWKYAPNEQIMNYTISELSNKYKVRQTGNLLDTLVDICYGAYTLHKPDIDKGLDYGITQFVSAVRTRINSMLKKISLEFYDNYNNGRYLGTEFESNDEDNYHEAASSIHAVTKVVDTVSMKLVVNGPPIRLVTIAAKNNKVSVNELRNYVNTMVVNEKLDDIKDIIESIVFIFVYNDQYTTADINSNDFIVYCMEVYRRSNTTDENVIKIKKILDSWLTELDAYKKTQRLATINNFRRALYMFFVMSIQYYNGR